MVCADFFLPLAHFWPRFFPPPFVLVSPYFVSYLLVYTFPTFADLTVKSFVVYFYRLFLRRRFFLRLLWRAWLALFTCLVVMYLATYVRVMWMINKIWNRICRNLNDVFLSALFSCLLCREIVCKKKEKKEKGKNIISKMEILAQCTTTE